MYSLNNSINECIDYYLKLINNYSFFGILVLIAFALAFIMIINVSNNNNFTLTIIFNSICMFLVFYKFGIEIINHLDSCIDQGIMHNICFYFINTIICLFVLSFWCTTKYFISACKISMIILYILILLNMSFALYVTYSINGDILITLGNIFPMIFIGNILAIGSYIYMIVLYFVERYNKYYVKKKHLLYK